MQAQDIITQLQLMIPQLRDEFTNNVDVASVIRSGTVLMVQCDGVHGAKVDDLVALTGSVTPIAVTSIERVDTLLTIITTTPHDFTYNPDIQDAPTFTIEGANEAVFNTTYTIKQVLNRKIVTAEVDDSGATSGTGTMTILGVASHFQDYNLPYKIQTIPSPTSFTVLHSGTTLLDPVGDIKARIGPRISGGVSADRMLAAYTEKHQGEYWLQVVLEDVDASRDLKSQSDALINRTLVVNWRQQVQDPFSVLLFVPASEDLSAREARDIAGQMWRPLCQSLLGHRFASGLADTEQGSVGFISHGFQDYNGAVYVHRYSFLQVVDLTFGDTVGEPKSVAMREIDFTLTPSTGDGTLSTTGIDLDEVPL